MFLAAAVRNARVPGQWRCRAGPSSGTVGSLPPDRRTRQRELETPELCPWLRGRSLNLAAVLPILFPNDPAGRGTALNDGWLAPIPVQAAVFQIGLASHRTGCGVADNDGRLVPVPVPLVAFPIFLGDYHTRRLINIACYR